MALVANSQTLRHRALAPAKTFQCRGYGECRMVFRRSEHLARHIRTHTGDRPFTCHCGKQFSRLDNMRQHAQTIHANKLDQNEQMMRDLASLHATMAATKTIAPRSKRQLTATGDDNLAVKQEDNHGDSFRGRPGTSTGYEGAHNGIIYQGGTNWHLPPSPHASHSSFRSPQRNPFVTTTHIPFGAATNRPASPFGAPATRHAPAQGSPFGAPTRTRTHPRPRLSLHHLQPPRRSSPFSASPTHSTLSPQPTIPHDLLHQDQAGQQQHHVDHHRLRRATQHPGSRSPPLSQAGDTYFPFQPSLPSADPEQLHARARLLLPHPLGATSGAQLLDMDCVLEAESTRYSSHHSYIAAMGVEAAADWEDMATGRTEAATLPFHSTHPLRSSHIHHLEAIHASDLNQAEMNTLMSGGLGPHGDTARSAAARDMSARASPALRAGASPSWGSAMIPPAGGTSIPLDWARDLEQQAGSSLAHSPSSTHSHGQHTPTTPNSGITMEVGGYAMELRMQQQQMMARLMAARAREAKRQGEEYFSSLGAGLPYPLNSPALHHSHVSHPSHHSQPHHASLHPAAGAAHSHAHPSHPSSQPPPPYFPGMDLHAQQQMEHMERVDLEEHSRMEVHMEQQHHRRPFQMQPLDQLQQPISIEQYSHHNPHQGYWDEQLQSPMIKYEGSNGLLSPALLLE